MLRALYRYPVKSMLGEEIDEAHVDERGLACDRCLALVDATSGVVASAKDPRRWGALLQARAAVVDLAEEAVRITLGDGTVILTGGEPARCNALLSAHLGRAVELRPSRLAGSLIRRSDPDPELLAIDTKEIVLGAARDDRLAAAAPEGTVFDHAPLHLIASASLARLAELEPAAGIEPARFRPNLVLDLPGGPFVDNELVGCEVRIGAELVVQVLSPSARCVVPSLRHGELDPSPAALRAVARHNRPELPGRGPRPSLGAYATVLHPGIARVGDRVTLA